MTSTEELLAVFALIALSGIDGPSPLDFEVDLVPSPLVLWVPDSVVLWLPDSVVMWPPDSVVLWITGVVVEGGCAG